MKEIFEVQNEFIQLNQLLKVLNWVESGSMANDVIDAGLVTVNGETEQRRRNKIKAGFVVEYDSNVVEVV